MTVHTMRPITALPRANARWPQRHPRPRPSRQVRAASAPEATVLNRFLRACNTAENSQLLWKSLSAAFVIGYAAYLISHWPHP